jgi:excisionase family DNA binding protein
MRLEDWQKWLDTQFLDEDEAAPPPKAEAPVQPPIAPTPVEQPSFTTTVHAPPPTPAPVIQTDEPLAPIMRAEAPITPPPTPVSSPQPAPATTSSGGFVDDVDVPSIERYLPFLRGAANPPVAQESAATPEATAVQPEEQAGVVEPAVSAQLDEEPSAGLKTEEAEIVTSAPETEDEPGEAEELDSQTEMEFAKELPAPTPVAVRRFGLSYKRSRQVRNVRPTGTPDQSAVEEFWNLVPKHLHVLVAMGSDDVTQNSYKRSFKESRIELIQRILDPTLSLEETARLLNVCPTTVRRYTNRGLLTHQRTQGDQRRFKLSDVLAFLEAQSRVKQ